MEEAGSFTFTAASHQLTIETFWLHFGSCHVGHLYTQTNALHGAAEGAVAQLKLHRVA